MPANSKDGAQDGDPETARPPALPDAEATMGRIEAGRRSDLAAQGRGDRAVRAEVANIRWAVRSALATYPGDDAAARLRAALAAIPGGDAKRRQQVRLALEILERQVTAGPVPTNFGLVLAQLLHDRLFTRPQAAREAGVCQTTLGNWLSGTCLPSARYRDAIVRLERMLGIEDGFLIGLARSRRLPHPALSAARQREIGLERPVPARVVRALSHDDLKLPADELREAVAQVARAQAEAVEPVARAVQAARASVRPPARSPLPGRFAEEVDAYCAAASAPGIDILAPFRPSGRRRTERGVGIDRSRFQELARYLCHEPSGPRLPEGDLTLAYLAFPSVATAFLGAKQRRLGPAESHRELYLTSFDVGLYGVAARMVSPPGGFLYQRPHLAERLVPLDGIVSAAEIAGLRAAWRDGCERLEREHRATASSIRGRAEVVVDRHLPVLPILESPDPLLALQVLNLGLARDVSSVDPDGTTRLCLERDAAMIHVLSQTAFRNRTTLALTTEHLREGPDGWRLEVPRQLFKNAESTFFSVGGSKRAYIDFRRSLIDQDGLGETLERYLSQVRPALLKGRRSDALFVTRPETKPVPAAMSDASVVDRVKLASDRHLAWQPRRGTGIPGVSWFAPHSIRDILATGVLKRTGDRRQAAAAIADTEDSIEPYLRYCPTMRDARDKQVSAALRNP